MIELVRRGDPFPGAAFPEPCYRIPALAVTPSGRLLAAFDVRRDHIDLPGDFDIALAHSDDDGRTWTTPRTLRRHEPGHGFGDVSLLADPATGRVHAFYAGSTGSSFWDDAEDDGNGLELWHACSEDDGDTWTHAPWTIDTSDYGSAFASSGNGIALSSGRLVQPMVVRPRHSTSRLAVMAISDDHGATWTLGQPLPDCDENKVVELADGRLLLHARDTPLRRQAYSDDAGETFSDPVPHPDLPDPSCNGGLVRLADGRLACTLLDPPSGELDAALDPTRGQGSGLAWGRRANLVVRWSDDDGLTWPHAAVIDPGDSAYSVLVALPDGSATVLYERGTYDSLAFATLPVTL